MPDKDTNPIVAHLEDYLHLAVPEGKPVPPETRAKLFSLGIILAQASHGDPETTHYVHQRLQPLVTGIHLAPAPQTQGNSQGLETRVAVVAHAPAPVPAPSPPSADAQARDNSLRERVAEILVGKKVQPLVEYSVREALGMIFDEARTNTLYGWIHKNTPSMVVVSQKGLRKSMHITGSRISELILFLIDKRPQLKEVLDITAAPAQPPAPAAEEEASEASTYDTETLRILTHHDIEPECYYTVFEGVERIATAEKRVLAELSQTILRERQFSSLLERIAREGSAVKERTAIKGAYIPLIAKIILRDERYLRWRELFKGREKDFVNYAMKVGENQAKGGTETGTPNGAADTRIPDPSEDAGNGGEFPDYSTDMFLGIDTSPQKTYTVEQVLRASFFDGDLPPEVLRTLITHVREIARLKEIVIDRQGQYLLPGNRVGRFLQAILHKVTNKVHVPLDIQDQINRYDPARRKGV